MSLHSLALHKTLYMRLHDRKEGGDINFNQIIISRLSCFIFQFQPMRFLSYLV